MNKSAGIAIGAIVLASALATGGAWYTGQQLPGVLNDTLQQANQEVAVALAGSNFKVNIELLSLDSYLFSSSARYKTTLQVQSEDGQVQRHEFISVDHIEHGPLPLSRLTSLKLMPVMAVSNVELENNESVQKWFTMSQGVSPLRGHTSIGYDRSLTSQITIAPLQMKDQDGAFTFSGLNLQSEASADGQKLKVTGNMGNLQLNVKSPEGPVALQLKGLTFDTGGTKGKAGFYLGHTNVKAEQFIFQPVGRPAVQFDQIVNTNLMQEEGDKLAAQLNYDIAKIAYDGKDIGSAHLGFEVSNLDVAATPVLYQIYQQKIAPQQQAAAAAGREFKLQLSPDDQQALDSAMSKLLAGKPHIELKKLSLKTANGESHLNVAADLTDPGALDQPQDELIDKSLSQFNARLVLSKAMIRDLVVVQASLQGLTDPLAVTQQASTVSEMAGSMAQALQLATVEGDNITSSLNYANGMVDFNGRKMTPEQFFALVMANSGALGAR